jgi:hypothetical protein
MFLIFAVESWWDFRRVLARFSTDVGGDCSPGANDLTAHEKAATWNTFPIAAPIKMAGPSPLASDSNGTKTVAHLRTLRFSRK